MTNYQNRFEVAFDQWIERGAPPSAARDLAHEQLTFEDEQSDFELNGSKGANDSFPIIL
jgi:hypothetical protein